MPREGDLMRKALRKHLIPALAAAGFDGRSIRFTRLRDARAGRCKRHGDPSSPERSWRLPT